MDKTGKGRKKHMGLWEYIQEGLPHPRNLKQIYKRAEKLFHPHKHKGAWTGEEEEDGQLLCKTGGEGGARGPRSGKDPGPRAETPPEALPDAVHPAPPPRPAVLACGWKLLVALTRETAAARRGD